MKEKEMKEKKTKSKSNNINSYKKIRKSLLFLSLLYLSLYIPLSFAIYSPIWYNSNYKYYDSTRLEMLHNGYLKEQTNNLILFFLHIEKLNNNFSKTEIKHLKEVRTIYDILFILFIVSLIILIKYYNKKELEKYAKTNIIIILATIIILPFFSYFWNYIFHPLLFNNNYWIYEDYSALYYMFPEHFFFNSLILIIVVSILINTYIGFKSKIIKSSLHKKQ